MANFNSVLNGLSACLDCLANFKTTANKDAGSKTKNINKVININISRTYPDNPAAAEPGEVSCELPNQATDLTWGQGVKRTGNIPRYDESVPDNPLRGLPGKITFYD